MGSEMCIRDRGSGELEALGDYEFVIEGENGNMQYYVTIDVSYTA